jgi:hypothetical protein
VRAGTFVPAVPVLPATPSVLPVDCRSDQADALFDWRGAAALADGRVVESSVAQAARESSVGTDARRAPRYAIVAPVRFRGGAGAWLEGTTVDIGRLGLLIRTRYPVPPPGTALQLRVALKAGGVRRGAYVACTGRVVRVDPRPGEGEVLMAVTIDEFQIEPAARSDEALYRTEPEA